MDFLALVTRIQHEDYSVAYRLRGKSVSAVPGDSFLTIVHTPGDQKTEVQAGSVTAAQFVDGTSVIACTKVAAWECKPSPQPVSTPVGAEALLYFLGLVVQNPGAFDTKTYQTDIVGVPVNCIRADPIEAAGEIGLIEVCVTAEGVPCAASCPTSPSTACGTCRRSTPPISSRPPEGRRPHVVPFPGPMNREELPDMRVGYRSRHGDWAQAREA